MLSDLDKDNDGVLNKADLSAVLSDLPEVTIDEIIERLDRKGNGTITYVASCRSHGTLLVTTFQCLINHRLSLLQP